MKRKTVVEEVKEATFGVKGWRHDEPVTVVPDDLALRHAERLDKAEALLMRISMEFHRREQDGEGFSAEEDRIWFELTMLLEENRDV